MTASAMQGFHKLFSGKPNPSTLSPELNAQIITVREDSHGRGFVACDIKTHLLSLPHPRLCMTTCPVRTTCSLCWPGLLSWRRHTFIWQGKKIYLPCYVFTRSVLLWFLHTRLGPVCRVPWVWVTSLASSLLPCPVCCHPTHRWCQQLPAPSK